MTQREQPALVRAALIGLLALIPRVAFVLELADHPLFDSNLAKGTDMVGLVGWARRIADGDLLGRGIGPFWWAPLYPYSLGGILAVLGRDALVGAALVQAGLSATTCVLLYCLGRRLVDETTGLVAGALGAVYGTAIFYTGIFLSTTLEIFLSVLTLLLVTLALARRSWIRWFLAGITAGLACLARPNFLVALPVLLAVLPIQLRTATNRPDWRLVRCASLALLLGTALTVAPVTARNWIVGHRLVLVSAAGPETFRIGNSYDSTPLNFVYPKQPPMPLTSIAFWRHQARKAVLFWWGFEVPQNVSYYLGREASRVLRLPWLPFWIAVPLTAVGLWVTRTRARTLAHVYAFLGTYYLSVVAFFVIARWRLPLVIPSLVFTAAALVSAARWVRERRWAPALAVVLVAAGLGVAAHPGPGPYLFAADHGQFAYLLANRGAYVEAIPHMRLAAAGLPQDPALQRDLGMLLLRVGQPAEARAHLERAVALAPSDPVAHRLLGRALLPPGGDPERARQHLEQALALAPEGPGAQEARALLQSLSGTGPP